MASGHPALAALRRSMETGVSDHEIARAILALEGLIEERNSACRQLRDADKWLAENGIHCPTVTQGVVRLVRYRDELAAALRDLVARCDGDAGVRADGSNIDTCAAHAALAKAKEASGG